MGESFLSRWCNTSATELVAYGGQAHRWAEQGWLAHHALVPLQQSDAVVGLPGARGLGCASLDAIPSCSELPHTIVMCEGTSQSG